jgi:hypothetical protein
MNAIILKGAALRQPPLPQSGPRAKTIALYYRPSVHDDKGYTWLKPVVNKCRFEFHKQIHKYFFLLNSSHTLMAVTSIYYICKLFHYISLMLGDASVSTQLIGDWDMQSHIMLYHLSASKENKRHLLTSPTVERMHHSTVSSSKETLVPCDSVNRNKVSIR